MHLLINTSSTDATSFFPERIIDVKLEDNEMAKLPKVADAQVVLFALMYGDMSWSIALMSKS